MAEFLLPKNSKISGRGRSYRAPEAKRVKKFRIYRWDPESGQNPRYDTSRSISTTAGRWSSTR